MTLAGRVEGRKDYRARKVECLSRGAGGKMTQVKEFSLYMIRKSSCQKLEEISSCGG